jgi:predicted ArsR family transcriptional regulator
MNPQDVLLMRLTVGPRVMTYDIETARRYRRLAARLRSLASGSDHKETVKTLVGVARDYERMAEVHQLTDIKNFVHLRVS